MRVYLPLDRFAQDSQHKDGALHVYIHERLGNAYSELKRARYALGVLEGHKEEYTISERNIEDKRKAMEQTLSDLDLPPSSAGGYEDLQEYLHDLDFVHVKDGLPPNEDTLESVCACVASICIIGSTFVDPATIIGKLDTLPLPPYARKRRCVSVIHAVPLFQNCVPLLICVVLQTLPCGQTMPRDGSPLYNIHCCRCSCMSAVKTACHPAMQKCCGYSQYPVQTVKYFCTPGAHTNANGARALPGRFVLFIDDLDRCTDGKAVAILEAVQLLFNETTPPDETLLAATHECGVAPIIGSVLCTARLMWFWMRCMEFLRCCQQCCACYSAMKVQRVQKPTEYWKDPGGSDATAGCWGRNRNKVVPSVNLDSIPVASTTTYVQSLAGKRVAPLYNHIASNNSPHKHQPIAFKNKNKTKRLRRRTNNQPRELPAGQPADTQPALTNVVANLIDPGGSSSRHSKPPFIVCFMIDPRIVVQEIIQHFGETLVKAGVNGYKYLDKLIQTPAW